MKTSYFLLTMVSLTLAGCKQEQPPKLDNPWSWISAGDINIAEPKTDTPNPKPWDWSFYLYEPTGWYEFYRVPEHYEVCFHAGNTMQCEAVDEGFRHGKSIDYLNLGGTK